MKQEQGTILTIAIVAFNSETVLQQCIDSLAAQSFRKFRVHIVDNGSAFPVKNYIILPDDRFVLINSEINTGYAGGANLGLLNTNTKWVISMNPDVLLSRHCLSRLLDAVNEQPQAAMAAPLLFIPKMGRSIDGFGDVLSIFGIAWRGGYQTSVKLEHFKQNVQVFSPCGAMAMYRGDIFRSLGGFDESFFCYLEDVDLGLRINSHGYKAILVPRAHGWHGGNASSKKPSGFIEFHTSKNFVNMIFKSVPIALILPMFVLHLLVFIWLDVRNTQRSEQTARRKGLLQSIRRIPSFMKQRMERKRYPLGASIKVANILSWSIKMPSQYKIYSWQLNP